MTALSEYLQSRVLKAIFHGETLELPANISIALTSDPAIDNQDGSNIPEIPQTISRSGVQDGVSGLYDYDTGYERLSVCTPQIDGDTAWEYDGSGSVSNIRNLVFNTCLEDWGEVSGVVILDSDVYGSGNVLFHGELKFPRTVREGDAVKYDAEKFEVCIQ